MSTYRRHGHSLLLLLLLQLSLVTEWPGAAFAQVISTGKWELLLDNAGISAMQMVLTHKNKVVMMDGFTAGPSNLSHPNGECRTQTQQQQQQDDEPKPLLDCTAHSVEYDIAGKSVRPLSLRSDPWCSAGARLADGSLLQLGGDAYGNNGSQAIRRYTPCDQCDWLEPAVVGRRLSVPRRYATAVVLADGATVALVGGRGAFSYELVSLSPPLEVQPAAVQLPFLDETNDLSQDNLYPFLHLLPDATLFVFANADSILLDVTTGRVVRRLPRLPGDVARNYPSSGSSVLLPLDAKHGFNNAEVLICGGASPTSFVQASRGHYVNASSSCGRLKLLDRAASWEMETMPSPRVMGDMVLLPTADVLIVNGAARGTAGWMAATSPALTPLLYKPAAVAGDRRFQVLEPATRPRMYHSAAILLPDASVLVAGSNPATRYTFTAPPPSSLTAAAFYSSDLSLEAFHPPYLDRDYAVRRPRLTYVSQLSPSRGESLLLRFQLRGYFSRDTLDVVLVAPPVASHAFSMGQRLLRLQASVSQVAAAAGVTGSVPTYDVTTTAPNVAAAAPAGYYMLFVVHAGLPSHAVWIKLLP